MAEARGLSAGTIIGHLERLVEEGARVDWGHLLPAGESRLEIETVLKIMGDNLLRPVWEELEGKYPYDEIRLVRLNRRSRESEREASHSGDLPPDPRSMMGR